MGVVIFGVMALYLVISLTVVLLVARAAKRKGKSPWGWGGAAALVMYLLVFWDHIPTVIAHKYYCEKEAGFWVYKTVGHWKVENPGVVETLSERNKPQTTGKDGQFRYWTTQRFYTDRKQMRFLHGILREEETLFDAGTGQALARSINFWRGQSGNVFAMGGTLDDYRQALVLGWGNRQCGATPPTEQMRMFRYQFQQMGEGK
jgi:hypothetical protein